MIYDLNQINTYQIMYKQQGITFNNNLFKSFIDYTDAKETTIKGYKTCIKKFMKYLIENDIKQPKREDIKAYKEYLNIQNYSNGTKAQYLRAVKHFFKWTNSEGLYPNIADNIKGVKVKHDNTKKESFNEEDIKTILNSIDRNTLTGKRDIAILLLCLTGGLRIIEIQRANIQDIQTIKGQKVLYIQGKGRDDKDEYIKLIDEVKQAIDDYLKARGDYKKSDPLFTGTSNRAKNQRITEPSLSRLIKNIFKKSGYDSTKLTAHSLRHTSNTLLFKSGADLYKVQKHARHNDPKTTEIYLHAANREKDTSEIDIYNQIFNPQKKELLNEITALSSDLTEEEQKEIIRFIKQVKKSRKIEIK